MPKKRNEKGMKFYIYMIMNLLSSLILNIRTNFYRYLGLLGVLILILSGIHYLFFSDTIIEHHDYASFPDPVTKTPNYYIFVSSTTENEFIVGQPIHIESYIVFADDQSYNNFKKNTPEIGGEKINLIMENYFPFETIFFTTNDQTYGKLILIISDASRIDDTNWFMDSVILISESNEPLGKELKSAFISEKYLKGETDVIFHQSGVHEIYTFSNGTKVPISTINISPRTIGYELKSNKETMLFALIGIGLAFLSLLKKKD